MTAPTITRLPAKARAVECARCSGEAKYLVRREGEQDVRVCCWCRRKYEVAA